MRIMCWYYGAKAPRNIEVNQAKIPKWLQTFNTHTIVMKEKEKVKVTSSYKKSLNTARGDLSGKVSGQ